MAIPFPYVTSGPTGINTGSYLNQSESDMFVMGFGTDLWYGFSEMDVMEVSVFDLDQNPIGWATLNTEKQYKTISLTYLNELDQPTSYTYNQLITDLVLYRNTKVLVNPIEQLSSSFGITRGSYILTYNFVREMAGVPTNPLVVKDISPSRKELKLTPLFGNNPRYEAFCRKKFQIKDVAPLLIQQTDQCPYSQIYARVKDKYAKEIAFLKQLLFLDTDAAFIVFLKSLYQDMVVYTAPPANQPLDTVKRTQGIRGYFQNFLLSNYEAISDFDQIDLAYDTYTVIRIENQFKPYGPQTGEDFKTAKQFLVDFFTTEFYHQITLATKASFEAKYYSYFKNALNLGNNQMFTIVDHSYMDERISENDPLTLLVKLKTELPEDIKIQTECWVTNISIAPFVVNAIFRSAPEGQTIKIAAPNFTLDVQNISLYNENASYNATDLRESNADQQTIDINKKINDLQVDYTNFSNFIVFSSAAQRVANFKTKISSWYILSSSLVTLEASSSQSVAAGTVYPQYALEKGSLNGQMDEIINSFDGYESYLFRTGSYTYNPSTATFVSASYIAQQDYTASLYDKTNRDSLLNNTPEHVVLDEESDEYLTFLNMIGHFFDNIYLYISNLPSERVVDNDPTKTISKKMVDYMLDSFGWKVGTTYEDFSILDTYTTALTSSMSAEDRTKAIRTRILSTLPQIYKTKGTEEAIRMLLSCHGLPSNLLEIREYGNNDYNSASLVTYTKQERSCLFAVSGSGTVYNQYYDLQPDVRTVEFKLLLEHPERIEPKVHYPFVNAYHYYWVKWDHNWSLHTNFPWLVPIYEALGYYSITTFPAWEIGFIKEYGNMGRIYAVLPTYSSSLYVNGFASFTASMTSFNGFISGSVDAATASVSGFGIVNGNAVFTASYWSGSVNGNPDYIASDATISGNAVGIISGYLLTASIDNVVGAFTSSLIYFTGSLHRPYNYGTSSTIFGTGSVLFEGVSLNNYNTSSNFFYGVTAAYLNRIAFGHPRIYLTSSIFPLFDGEIFNVRLRRNAIDANFQYSTDEQLVPTTYDLTVQRNEAGRQVWRSIDSAIGQYEDNMIWDGVSVFDPWEATGSIGTTTTMSIDWGESTYLHNMYAYFGNAMVWDVPISDADFEIHCNDYSSFAYSGSEAEKHLITRMDADEATNFLTDYYAYEYYYGNFDTTYYYAYAVGEIENKSEYYSTFRERYGTVNSTGVVASGSWLGAHTGSLYTIERFTGSFKGTVSGSLSGSGQGWFITQSVYGNITQSKFIGTISGSMTGSFNGLSTGTLSSSTARVKGRIGSGLWYGETFASDLVSQSYFTGSYTGSVSGTFWGWTYGQITSSTYGMYVGRLAGTGWTGQVTGSVSGSMRAIYMSGSFNGVASASNHFIVGFGSITGSRNQIWYGSLSGSHTGSFTGSSAFVKWSGSSYWSPYGYGEYTNGQMMFTGSFAGTMTSSQYDNQIPRATYATGAFSGSFIQAWTGSPMVLYNEAIMPSYINYYSFDYWFPLNATRSSDVEYCGNVHIRTYSEVYPYEYLVKSVEKTYTTPSYGPNRFRNEKVNPQLQNYDVRLDDKDRSTYDTEEGLPKDSNIVGLYLDPQDAKNRDIVKYYGNNNVINLIADPSNMYSQSYSGLRTLNLEYNSYGDRQVLYNELITLYKIYFNRSIFDAVKNVIPARATVRTGIVVEPTVLERPKYQHKRIFSEENTGSVFYDDVTASHYCSRGVKGKVRDPYTKLVQFSGSKVRPDRVNNTTFIENTSRGNPEVLWGDFNIDTSYSQSSFNTGTIPPKPTIDLDVSYINEANFIYPVNYGSGYIPDLPDEIQFGNYGSLGDYLGYPVTIGVTSQEDLNKFPHASGSKRAFLVKKWDKYTIYSKSGSYTRTSNKGEDVYLSSSVWLYSLVGMTPTGYEQIFYTSSKNVFSASSTIWDLTTNETDIGGLIYYVHFPNTAIGTNNQKINTIKSTDNHSGLIVTAGPPYVNVAKESFFEVFGGYPRNHYTHKRMQYSPVKFLSLSGRYDLQTAQIYVRGSQTVTTTIDNESGIEDATLPVQTIQTSNVNLQKSDNVINQ